MCRAHWLLVPKRLKNALREASRKQGCNVLYQPLYAALADVIEHVATLEGRPEHNDYRRVADTLSRPRHPLHKWAFIPGAELRSSTST